MRHVRTCALSDLPVFLVVLAIPEGFLYFNIGEGS
jgi:hypothetical protein